MTLRSVYSDSNISTSVSVFETKKNIFTIIFSDGRILPFYSEELKYYEDNNKSYIIYLNEKEYICSDKTLAKYNNLYKYKDALDHIETQIKEEKNDDKRYELQFKWAKNYEIIDTVFFRKNTLKWENLVLKTKQKKL